MKYDFIPNNNYIKLLSMKHAYDDFYMEQYSILEKIVDSYNKEMGLLVEKGIFNQIKEEKKNKNKKRVRK